jgi:hypothetical protein
MDPDLLLSIGSGHGTKDSRPEIDPKNILDGVFGAFKPIIQESQIYHTFKVLKNRFHENLNSEISWKEHFVNLSDEKPGHYIRLNLKFTGQQPALDKKQSLYDGKLEAEATKFIKTNKDTIERITRRLVATSFYFQRESEKWQYDGGILYFKGMSSADIALENGRQSGFYSKRSFND